MRSSWLLIFVLGCGKDICIRNSDCVLGEVCGIDGECATVAGDAGVDADLVDAMVTTDTDPVMDAGFDVPDKTPDKDGGL